MTAWMRSSISRPRVLDQSVGLPHLADGEAVARPSRPSIRRLGETTPPFCDGRDDGRKQHPASVKRIAGLFPAHQRSPVKTRGNGWDRIWLAR